MYTYLKYPIVDQINENEFRAHLRYPHDPPGG